MDTAEGVAKGCKTVDLDSLAFAQGGHLMSSKGCQLPKKSYRVTQKVRCMQITLLYAEAAASLVFMRGGCCAGSVSRQQVHASALLS